MQFQSVVFVMLVVLALLENSLPVYAGLITNHAITGVGGETDDYSTAGGVDGGGGSLEQEYASHYTDSFSAGSAHSYGAATSSLFSLSSVATASAATTEGDTSRRWGRARQSHNGLTSSI